MLTAKKEKASSMNAAAMLQAVLEEGKARTQEEIVKALRAKGVAVNQSTISRTIRKIGAVKTLDERGRAVYRLPVAGFAVGNSHSLTDLVVGIDQNEYVVMIHTRTGSASVVAQLIDEHQFPEILGTIAGDGEILVVPKSVKMKKTLYQKIRQLLQPSGSSK